jgi:hypothetical protein
MQRPTTGMSWTSVVSFPEPYWRDGVQSSMASARVDDRHYCVSRQGDGRFRSCSERRVWSGLGMVRRVVTVPRRP